MIMNKYLRPVVTFYTILILNVTIIQVHSSCDQNNEFSENSEQYLKVSRSQRRGRRNKAEIIWDPFQMMNDPLCYDIQSAKLEIKTDKSANWTTSEEEFTIAGKKRKWTVDIKPCLTYSFRINLPFNSKTENSSMIHVITPEKILKPLMNQELLKSDYSPEPPNSMSANASSDSVVLSWESSDCVTEYEVVYFEIGYDDNSKTKLIKNKTSVIIDELIPCTIYNINVYSIFNDNYEDLETVFTTKPLKDVLSDLEVVVKVTSNEIQISWPTWENISCIKQYQIKARLANNSDFVQDEVVPKNIGSPTLTHHIKGLASNSNYTVYLIPLFEGIDLNVKEIHVKTEPSSDSIQIENSRVNNSLNENSSHQEKIEARRKERGLIRNSASIGRNVILSHVHYDFITVSLLLHLFQSTLSSIHN